MKRYLAAFLSLVFIFLAAACNSPVNSEKTEPVFGHHLDKIPCELADKTMLRLEYLKLIYK